MEGSEGMNDFFALMWRPLAACFILTGIHAYLGIHVVERKVIFVDLALAQIAALGAVIALVFHLGLHEENTYWFSLGATFIGAIVFAMTRTRKEKVPHEAVIGIIYAVAAAASILFLSRTAEGDEHIRHMLVGDILLVGTPEIIKLAILYSCIGLIHWIFREKFRLISMNPEKAFKEGVPVKRWDLLFYLTFGVVVTSSVQIAGVLLVFSFLIVPSVAAMLFASAFKSRLLFGWGVGIIASCLGVLASYYFDYPTGATIVCVFGALLAALAAAGSMLKKV